MRVGGKRNGGEAQPDLTHSLPSYFCIRSCGPCHPRHGLATAGRAPLLKRPKELTRDQAIELLAASHGVV